MNKYRVDRANCRVTPCGMNSLLYLGDDIHEAFDAFDGAETGIGNWGQPCPLYGVLLSSWNPETNAYVVISHKGGI